MGDAAALTVDGLWRADGCAAVALGNGLVAEAYAKDGGCCSELFDDIDAYACLIRCARAGGEDDGRGSERGDLLYRDLVVAHDMRLLTGLLQIAREVVNKGVVIIDDQDHGSPAFKIILALSIISWTSAAGFELVVMPLPAFRVRVCPSSMIVRMRMFVSRSPLKPIYPIAPQ